LAGVTVSALILVWDSLTPLGVAGGVPYVALVLLSMGTARERDTYYAAMVGTILTVVGYSLSPEGGEPAHPHHPDE